MLRGPPVAGLLAATLLVAGVLPVGADHAQSGPGRTVSFDHKAGNEWWVEVVLGGRDASTASRVEAMDTGGAWVPLTLRSWGAWAASFHVEPGHQVRFRASWPGGEAVESCWFTHPAGVEQCGPGPFDAGFTMVKGNEWWVQAQVTPSEGHTVSAVHVRADAGDWKPLSKQSWGVREWAGSHHFPQGSVLQLRATSATGATALSSCYRWIPPSGQDAVPFACSSTAFDATFSGVKGNEWWVEARVAGNQAIAGVDARVGCSPGAWTPLTLRSWGAWAASFRIPPGSHVDFRARSAGGATDLSGAYVWPQATPTDPCDAPWPRESSFAQVRFRAEERWDDEDGSHLVRTDGLLSLLFHGGAWDGTCEVRRDHRDGSGRWTNATETWPWDQAPPKGEVGFRDGQADVETVENCAHVLYPDMDVAGRETRTFSLRTASGDPIAIDAHHAHESGPTHDDHFWWDARHGLMLQWDLDSTGGSNARHAEGWLLNTDAPLAAEPFDARFSNVKGNEWWVQATVAANQPVSGVQARVDGGPWQPLHKQSWGDWAASFHVRLGSHVQLLAVAAGGATDLSDTYVWPSASVVQDWPREGSFVQYTLRSDRFLEGQGWQETSAILRLERRGGAWSGTCDGTTVQRDFEGNVVSTTPWAYAAGFGPAVLPTSPAAGDALAAGLLRANPTRTCGPAETALRVVGPADFQTSMRDANGNPVVLHAWHAREADETTADSFAMWDRHEGLLLQWHHHPHASQSTVFRGGLVDTDAPIR